MTDKRLTQKDVNDKAAVQQKAMTEADFQSVNPKGHRRFHTVEDALGNAHEIPGPDASGHYKWANAFVPNDGHGKLTRMSEAINEGMDPFDKADGERMSAMQSKVERGAMRDADGGVHYVEPGKMDDCASRNGWGHAWRAGGLILKAGPDGMDFRLIRDEWEATGIRLVRGERIPVPTTTIQRDPDGQPWQHFNGEWRRCV